MKGEQDQPQSGEDEIDHCKLKVYSKRNKRAPVLIADFSHGELKNETSDVKFQCLKKGTENVGCDATRELVASTARLNYIGSSSPSPLQYFVGVRNKTTGKMKLYDSVLFRMKPDLKKMVSYSQPVKSKSYWEGVNELTETFGSKARKRALNTLQKCTVETSLDKSLTVDESLLRLSPDRSNNDEINRQMEYLPPQNRNAPIPSEVFDLNDIISPEENSALDHEAQDILTATEFEFNKKCLTYCKYVSECFNSGTVSATKAKLLLYYDYLIKFQHLKYNDIRKKEPAPNIPNPFKKHILEKFTLMSSNDKGRSSRSCPTQMKDKLVAYIFVLALFINEFSVDLEKMHIDLNNVGIPKLKTIAEVLGCSVSKNKAELRMPLKEVVPKYSKRSASKRF